MHIIFYDGECPLCNRAVRFILAADQKKIFRFAPLNGKLAEQELKEIRLRNLDTLVLLQDYQTDHQKMLIEGKGGLRVLWLLGGKYAWLGWLSFLPGILFDLVYRLIARYRYRLFKTKFKIEATSDRFLE